MLFLKENKGGVDIGQRGSGGRDWEEWREGKLGSGCNV